MELSKNYIPSAAEDKWYAHWLNKRYFNSRPDGRPAFTVVIPPPNVTGVLHMGHTLNETVQDILVRKARMSGFNACWVPGSDHASIATEAKVVGMLKERGIDKNTLSRPAFMEYAYEWKDKYGGIIYHQIKKLGCSVDWDRVSFTMDPDYYSSVISVFVDLHKKGLIYRGARMINWDPAAKTALSDEEVEYREEMGKLYYVRYGVVNEDGSDYIVPVGDPVDTSIAAGGLSDGSILVATQRPETIMGDTAICVNPSDERYRGLAGKYAIVPLVNRRVPIIFDDYVDPAFGTGALKVTPAHDINDYNLGLKHGLPIIDTLNEDGTLSAAAEILVGMERFAARKKVVELLRAAGLLSKEEEHPTRIGFSQRTSAVVEPRISTQWFVKMKEMAEPALKAVTEGHITIHPGDKFLATYKYWLENVKDWCISRQLWWGQQIPAWYAPDGSFRVAATREEAWAQFGARAAGGSDGDAAAEAATGENLSGLGTITGGRAAESAIGADGRSFTIGDLKQDEDVLDTWFSSWLWPIEVFKGVTHPGNPDISYYYPTSVLVTGQDIIFFWVARMIMAGLYYFPDSLPMEKRIPFRDVYFTGMVRDKQGRKMSKSLGNSPDLLDLIDKYGADAVRFGIMISSPAGNDLLFDEGALEQGRNFNNKLWNALKLVQLWEGRMQPRSEGLSGNAAGNAEGVADNGKPTAENGKAASGNGEAIAGKGEAALGNGETAVSKSGAASGNNEGMTGHFAIQWFESRLMDVRAELEKLFKDFKLSEALKTLYSLIWDDFCSWYLEWVKPGYEQGIDAGVYEKTVHFYEELMQLLHPFMPFITEEIYHLLKERKEGDDLCILQFGIPGLPDVSILEQGRLLKEAITVLRDARNKAQIKPKELIHLHIQSDSVETYTKITDILARQVNAENIAFTQEIVEGALAVVLGKDKFYIGIDREMNSGDQKEEMQKELSYLKGFLDSVNKKLSNERFVQNAKPAVIDLERKKQADTAAKIKVIEETLSGL